MQVKSIAECSFRPSLSYHIPLKPLFCLFLSGRLRQVLLNNEKRQKKHLTMKSFFFYVKNAEIVV